MVKKVKKIIRALATFGKELKKKYVTGIII